MEDDGKLAIFILSGLTISLGMLVVCVAYCKAPNIMVLEEEGEPENSNSREVVNITDDIIMTSNNINEDEEDEEEEEIMVMMTFENRDYEETDV